MKQTKLSQIWDTLCKDTYDWGRCAHVIECELSKEDFEQVIRQQYKYKLALSDSEINTLYDLYITGARGH